MKKILTFMIMLGVFLIPRYTTQAALTPPALYDYSFVYDSTDGEFQFKDGTNSYTPEFTRTADGIYFNYTYTGDADGLLPFEVTLTFNRSNTLWTLGTTGYIATDTKIGSDNTVGSITKNSFIFNNISINDFLLYFDISSTSTFSNGFSMNYNSSPYFTFIIQNNGLIAFINNSKSVTNIVRFTNASLYLDALYWQDLGQSAAYAQGELDGYAEGLEDNTAYVQGYNVGYTDGLVGGQDMETGSSIIVFVVGAIGFIMMIFGFTTKRRIFNLLSVGAFIVLGGLLAQYVGFIIITIGLVIVNVYYTFWGDL